MKPETKKQGWPIFRTEKVLVNYKKVNQIKNSNKERHG